CEDVLTAEYRRSGFPVTIVRPSHTYGNYSMPTALHGEKGSWQIARRMLAGKPVIVPGDGATLWTVTRSEDFAKGFVGLMGNIHAIGEAVYITSDESLTWNQIYQCIGAALGVKPIIKHISTDFLVSCDPEVEGGLWGDKSNTVVFDNSKIKRLVPGFNAEIRCDQGMRMTVGFLLANKELQQEDKEFDEWCDKVIAAYDEGLKSFKKNL
ncbi:MAG: NAD-dependent epimerase/dehydratase family protein, partial [Defluviitaleaceae bacterium]|nr:NAD-dependent epimerase/dehydratase family protein [Defluviitaleaceae bacterium]